MYLRFTKRIFDLSLSLISLIILSPLFLITGLLIKISSKGPIIYYSERAGINHKKIKFYKFRSMHITNHDKGLFIADDERLFLVGRIIRRLKIDELPQLLNVLKGDMSIVGPRPMIYTSVDRIYSGKYKRILDVKPGLTSAASLFDYTVGDSYTDNKRYMKEVLPIKLELELLYLDKQCFKYDLNLVIRTIITIVMVLFGKKDFPPQPELKEITIENKTGK